MLWVHPHPSWLPSSCYLGELWLGSDGGQGRGVGRAADGRGSVGLPGLVHGHAPEPGTVPDMEKAFDKRFLNIYRMAR